MKTGRAFLVLALALSLVALVAALSWRPEAERPSGPTTGLRVIVVGIDGLDWFLAGEYAERERLPALSRILRSAVTGEITAERPVIPDVGWIQIGRGRPLSELESTAVRPGGDGAILGQTPELGRVVEEAGGTVLVVGWPGSWPARPGRAAVVAAYAPPAVSHGAGLCAALFADAPGQASDEALSQLIARTVRANEAAIDAEFESRILPRGAGGDARWSEHVAAAKWALLSDLSTLDVACRLIAETEPDCSLVGLMGLDVVSHRFLAPAMPDYFPGLGDDGDPYQNVLGNYYRFVDSALERILRLTDDRTLVIVCSAYGVHPGAPPGPSGSHDGGPPGVFMARGPRLIGSESALAVATLDVAPTVVAALGIPVPSDWDGRVLVEALPDGLIERFPVTAQGPATRADVTASPDRAPMDRMVTTRMETLSGTAAP